MEFKTARLDTLATIISIFVTTLLVGLSIMFISKVPYGWIGSVIMVLIVLISYLLSPKRYFFEGSKFIIEKVVGTKIVIPLSEIEGYAAIPNLMKLKVARTFGNGGLFGYYGIFSTAEYGIINCQLTSLKNILIIKSKKGNFAISPLEFDKFEEYLKTTVSGITGEIVTIQPMEPEKMKYANAFILIIPIVLFVLTIMILLLTYAQLPDRIAIHFDFHGNPDGWGSRTSYLVSGIVPSSVLLCITIILFFCIRRTTSNPAVPNFWVILMSFVQIFVAYISFDTYWINRFDTHLIPLWYITIGFLVILAVLLLFYYRNLTRQGTG